MKARHRVRLHLHNDAPSIEGLLVREPWNRSGHYELVDVQVLESRVDKHDLDSRAVRVPLANVAFYEVLT